MARQLAMISYHSKLQHVTAFTPAEAALLDGRRRQGQPGLVG